jgi:Arc/MetJ family transcription regulator
MAGLPYFSLAVWQGSHTVILIMKMTMHIDEDVLDRVMKITGAKTKTDAVEIALTEMARRHKLKELFNAGLGLTPDELKASFAPSPSDAFDHAGSHFAVAEDPAPYGQPRPPRQ